MDINKNGENIFEKPVEICEVRLLFQALTCPNL